MILGGTAERRIAAGEAPANEEGPSIQGGGSRDAVAANAGQPPAAERQLHIGWHGANLLREWAFDGFDERLASEIVLCMGPEEFALIRSFVIM